MAKKKAFLPKNPLKLLLYVFLLAMLLAVLVVGIKLVQAPKETEESEAAGNYVVARKYYYRGLFCQGDPITWSFIKEYSSRAACYSAHQDELDKCKIYSYSKSYKIKCVTVYNPSSGSGEEGGSGVSGGTYKANKYTYTDSACTQGKSGPIQTYSYASQRLCWSAIGSSSNQGKCNPYGTKYYKWICSQD